MRTWRGVWLLALAALLAVAAVGCAQARRPFTVSREALGTVVTVTAYGDDDAAVRRAAEAAFAAMSDVEAAVDPYEASSTVSAFNADPYAWRALPPAANVIIDRVASLGVGTWFSPALFGVTRLYDFGGKGSVPATAVLSLAVAQASAFERDSGRGRFLRPALVPPPPGTGSALPTGALTSQRPGLDLGGAAKGVALDKAMAAVRKAPGIRGAMISAGSSTLAWGRKSDAEPWRVGVEDPRRTGRVVAVIGAADPDVLSVSTSGDYQQYFERGGVRYHHILDPATGRPARGLRSLTVYGDLTGLDADVLSTALFVMGPTAARDWARRHGVGLYAVDDRGRVIAVSASGGAGVTFERTAAPLK